jgi:hypothetical protein
LVDENIFMRHYILKGKEPVQVYDLFEWAKWSEHADKTVKRTVLPDGVIISTVFIGTDSNVSNAFPQWYLKLLFKEENMICIRKDTQPGRSRERS